MTPLSVIPLVFSLMRWERTLVKLSDFATGSPRFMQDTKTKPFFNLFDVDFDTPLHMMKHHYTSQAWFLAILFSPVSFTASQKRWQEGRKKGKTKKSGKRGFEHDALPVPGLRHVGTLNTLFQYCLIYG
jgi:hypothetical protein